MQADHVDMIAKMEAAERGVRPHPLVSDPRLRCRFCWRKGVSTPTPGKKGDHFCRWNIKNQGEGRNPDPKPYRQPIYRWVDE